MSKNPKKKGRVTSSKKPKIDSALSPESFFNKKPVWRLGKIDLDGNWGFHHIDNASILKNLHQKLKNFETMSWREIEKPRTKSGNTLNHEITTDKICKGAQKRLKEIRLADDYDTLYSFHLSSTERLWGIRDSEAFYIVWWDRNHTVYPVGKKHT